MPHALQVHFRRLTPSEELVLLAKRRFEELRIDFQGSNECVVSLARRDGTPEFLVDAHVRITSGGDVTREAHAAHRDPQLALANALDTLEAALAADEEESVTAYLQQAPAYI
jgi:ribosome-associated translation inhibitor RaiA